MACPLAGAALVLCILACWPKQRSTFTLNRQLGMRTTVATDSYMTALRWARVRLPLIEQAKVSWYFEAQTWMAYADLDPELKEPGPFVLSDGGPPTPAYRPVVSRPAEGPDATAKLYALGEGWANWLRRQHRKPPLERYPAIMRPLADGPYSPHNNGLQDVQRLKWPW